MREVAKEPEEADSEGEMALVDAISQIESPRSFRVSSPIAEVKSWRLISELLGAREGPPSHQEHKHRSKH